MRIKSISNLAWLYHFEFVTYNVFDRTFWQKGSEIKRQQKLELQEVCTHFLSCLILKSVYIIPVCWPQLCPWKPGSWAIIRHFLQFDQVKQQFTYHTATCSKNFRNKSQSLSDPLAIRNCKCCQFADVLRIQPDLHKEVKETDWLENKLVFWWYRAPLTTQ